jgi:hypothetical protein
MLKTEKAGQFRPYRINRAKDAPFSHAMKPAGQVSPAGFNVVMEPSYSPAGVTAIYDQVAAGEATSSQSTFTSVYFSYTTSYIS